MNSLSAVQSVTVIGICGFLYFKFKNSIIPNVAGFVDGIAGTAIRPLVVPPGVNTEAVNYWKEHGIDQAWFMSIASGDQSIPEYVRRFLPDSATVGHLYNAFFNWSQETIVSDLEEWFNTGFAGDGGAMICNLAMFADANLWRINELELIYNSIIEGDLWDVVL